KYIEEIAEKIDVVVANPKEAKIRSRNLKRWIVTHRSLLRMGTGYMALALAREEELSKVNHIDELIEIVVRRVRQEIKERENREIVDRVVGGEIERAVEKVRETADVWKYTIGWQFEGIVEELISRGITPGVLMRWLNKVAKDVSLLAGITQKYIRMIEDGGVEGARREQDKGGDTGSISNKLNKASSSIGNKAREGLEYKRYRGLMHDLYSPLMTIRAFMRRLREKYPSEYEDFSFIHSYISAVQPLWQMSEEDRQRKLPREVVEPFIRKNIDGFYKKIQSLERFEKDIDDEGLSKTIKYIIVVSHNALRVMEQLLFWAGHSYGPCNISEIAEGIVAPLRNKYPEITFVIDIDNSLKEDTIFAHCGIIRDKWEELVKNAVKYSRADKIELRVLLLEQEEEGQVEFLVKDNGKGIAPDRLKRIFEQGHTEAETPEIGTGEGLYAARREIETVCGHIWVKSEVGKGAEFGFTVPFLWTSYKDRGKEKLSKRWLFLGLRGALHKEVAFAIAARLGARYLNPGYLIARQGVFLSWDAIEQTLEVDLNNPVSVAEHIKRLWHEFVGYKKEPVLLKGMDTTSMVKGHILREFVKFKTSVDLKTMDEFYRITDYPEVKKVIEEILQEIVEYTEAGDDCTTTVMFTTEPYTGPFWGEDSTKFIMFTASPEARAPRVGLPPVIIKWMDKRTGKEKYGPGMYPRTKIEKVICTDNLTGRQAYLKLWEVVEGEMGASSCVSVNGENGDSAHFPDSGLADINGLQLSPSAASAVNIVQNSKSIIHNEAGSSSALKEVMAHNTKAEPALEEGRYETEQAGEENFIKTIAESI
ncbi:MAG: hypothetical protein DRN95_07970, partial [Candidatus Hydrothermarchaeota archaeon]